MVNKPLLSYQGFLSKSYRLINKDRFPHAIMLNSTDGLPGVYLAESISKAILCSGTEKPCGVCNSCRLTENRSHPDLLYTFPFISAGKTGSSENYISEWKEFLSGFPVFLYEDWNIFLDSGNKQLGIYTGETHRITRFQSMKPYLSKKKVIILYMSELIHPVASNKLLKTIEEPLPNTHIILITNHYESNLKTITSRCQTIKVPTSLPKHFNSEVEQMNMGLDSDIAQIANNNLGLYSHLSKNKNEMIDFGNHFLTWLRHCFNNDIVGFYKDCENFSSASRDQLIIMLESFLKLFRDAFVDVDLSVPGTQLTSMSRLAPFVNKNNAKGIYNTIQKVTADLHRNANTKLALFDASISIHNLLSVKSS